MHGGPDLSHAAPSEWGVEGECTQRQGRSRWGYEHDTLAPHSIVCGRQPARTGRSRWPTGAPHTAHATAASCKAPPSALVLSRNVAWTRVASLARMCTAPSSARWHRRLRSLREQARDPSSATACTSSPSHRAPIKNSPVASWTQRIPALSVVGHLIHQAVRSLAALGLSPILRTPSSGLRQESAGPQDARSEVLIGALGRTRGASPSPRRRRCEQAMELGGGDQDGVGLTGDLGVQR